MSRWGILGLVTLAAWLQAYLLAALTSWHSLVNLLLPLLLGIVLTRSLLLSLTAALWGGFWLDVASTGPLGVHMLFYAGFVLGVTALQRGGLEFNRRLVTVAVLAVGVLLYHNWLVLVGWLTASSSLWQPRLWQFWVLDIVLVWLTAAYGKRWLPRFKAMGGW